MKFFVLLFLCLGCVQTYNSNSNDDQLFKEQVIDTSTPDGQRFAAAYEILEAKCMNCHTGNKRHAHWASYTAENDWYATESGQVLVEPNDAKSSAIIYRLKIWGDVGGMPEGPEQLTESEYNTLKDWIDNIGS